MRNVTNALNDEVLETKGLASDYAVAKLLGVRPQTVTNYRSGCAQLSDEIALRSARMMRKRLARLLVIRRLSRLRTGDLEDAAVGCEGSLTPVRIAILPFDRWQLITG